MVQLGRGKLMALLLGPAGVGVFNQLSLLFNLAQLGGQLGAFNGLVRHSADAIAAEDRAALRQLSATATILLGITSCLFAAAGVFWSGALSDLLLHDGGRHADLVALVLLAVPVAVTAQTYRALLSGARAVRALVRMQLLSDLGALLVFVALIFPLGLQGAVLGFMASHVLLFLVGAMAVRRELGRGLLLPRPALFRTQVVRENAGFGVIGMFMTGVSNLSVLLVSTMVIAALGAAANGIFANGWRIASVYLSAVTATTISYFLPTLVQAADDRAMSVETNQALRFYLIILPPLMAGIMIGSELLVLLILSSEFLPVAALLLLFVPAELLRILAETSISPYLARKRLTALTGLFLIQPLVFIAGAWLLLPSYGLAGAATAYLLSTGLWLMATLAHGRNAIGLTIERSVVRSFARAFVLLAIAASLATLLPLGPARIGAGGAAVLLWLWLGLHDRSFVATIRPVLDKLRPARAKH